MTARTAWTAGNGQGLTYGVAINSSDMVSMTTAQSVLSSVSDITNGTALDMFADVSFSLTMSASNTLAAGANIGIYIYNLNQDTTTYGDNNFVAGTPKSATPVVQPAALVALPSILTTTFVGTATGIAIPPGSFRFAMQNNCGFTLSAGTQTMKYRTYNVNLNN